MLETRGLTKRFGDCVSVDQVSARFESGQIHAVLGENGAGKSTLMKLLFGLHQPSEGSIHLFGEKIEFRSSMDAIRRGMGMVQQHFSLVDTLSVIDNITLGAECVGFAGRLRRDEAIKHLETRLPSPHLKLPWHSLVGDLTVGQKQRVEILKLLFRDSKILFLDEPTAVLTPSEIEDFFAVLRQMKTAGHTIILITHKINEVFAICDTYTVLRQGRMTGSGLVHEIDAAGLVELMIGRKLSAERPARTPALETKAISAVSVRDLETRGNDQSPGRLQDISLHVARGEIVGVAGVEGSGQSAFVDILMGLRDFNGELAILDEPVHFGSTHQLRELGCALVPEDRLTQGLWLEESYHSNMIIGLEDRFAKYGQVIDLDRVRSVTSEWARDFDVRAVSLDVSVGSLSGGNQQKVIFSREVSGRQPRVLICHQPTRGIDLGAIDLIHRKLVELRNAGLAVLILSSELDELLELSDRMYVFFEGRVSAEFARRDFDRLRIGAAMTGAQHA